MVVIESSFPRIKVFGMVFKSVFLYGKMGGKTEISKKCILDYQIVKCSVWIYSIINILLVVVALQQQTTYRRIII